jgi:rfaE bifunctional protein kinase chain/domain
MTGFDFDQLFTSFSRLKVGVIGDVMLDTYWWGKVDRISPEAPVPVVAVTKREQRIGGAGNVALNIKALDAQVQLISVLGRDDDGQQLTRLLSNHQIQSDYMVMSNNRITTNKIRIISRNQQMMRLDAEVTTSLSPDEEGSLMKAIENYIQNEKPDIIILEDYNKGVLTEKVIHDTIALCKASGVITAVDPKKKNFFSYQGVDIFKPNLHEVREALQIHADDVHLDGLKNVHVQLHKKLLHHISFITLSERGVFFDNGNEAAIIPTHIRNIADVSGAGDTVIAVAAVVYAATKNEKLMSELANVAGGLVCEEVGTAAINKTKLLQECKKLFNGISQNNDH